MAVSAEGAPAAALVTATYADDFAAFGYCAGYACIARGQLD